MTTKKLPPHPHYSYKKTLLREKAYPNILQVSQESYFFEVKAVSIYSTLYGGDVYLPIGVI